MTSNFDIGEQVLNIFMVDHPMSALLPSTLLVWVYDGDEVSVATVDSADAGLAEAQGLVRKHGRKADMLISTEPVEYHNGDLGCAALISIAGSDDTLSGLWTHPHRADIRTATGKSSENLETMLDEIVAEFLAAPHVRMLGLLAG